MELTRRSPNGAIQIANEPPFLLCCVFLFIVGLVIVIIGCFWFLAYSDNVIALIEGCFSILVAGWGILDHRRKHKRHYTKWRLSFADDQMSTENQNHWFPQFSRYTLFSWWKKLRKGPWNARKWRRDTGAAEIPYEPIQSNIDEPPRPSAQCS